MSENNLETLKQHLYQTNSEYRELAREHQRSESRLNQLLSQQHPRPDELEEAAILKRRKLTLKDRMQEILKQNAKLAHV